MDYRRGCRLLSPRKLQRFDAPLEEDAFEGLEREPMADAVEADPDWLWSRSRPNLLAHHEIIEPAVRQLLDDYSWRFMPDHGDRYDVVRVANEVVAEARGSRENYGCLHHAAKLDEVTVRQLRERSADGCSYATLAAEFDLAPTTIQRAVKGRTWAHVK